MEMQRLFIAIDLPPEVKDVVAQAHARFKATSAHTAVRWVDEAGAHITLKYLGETDQFAAITAALAQLRPQFRPFNLITAQPGAFPNLRQPRIVWLGVAGDLARLSALQYAVEELITPLGFPRENRPFHPHITLGRTKAQAAQAALAQLSSLIQQPGELPAPLTWSVSELVVMLSDTGPNGVRYTPLQRVVFDSP